MAKVTILGEVFMFRLIGCLLVVGFLAGCTTQKNWSATGGSRSDATVTLSYDEGEFEKAVLSESEAISMAKKRCRSWGYSGAEAFGGTTRRCTQFGGFNGCRTWFVSKEFQCSGDGSAVASAAVRGSAAKSAKETEYGKYQIHAEKLAGSHGCDDVKLMTQNPPVEVFQATCSNMTYLVRCEWGECAVVK